MAEHCRFFNSAEDDLREYTAAEFAEYFSRFLSDGLYTINGRAGLKVTPGAGLSINIDTGYAFIRGYMYKNDSVMTKGYTFTVFVCYRDFFHRCTSYHSRASCREAFFILRAVSAGVRGVGLLMVMCWIIS
jgi:hypothetical protein